MAIFSRFGDECILVRETTPADIRTFEGRKPDKQDKERFAMHMLWIARYVKIEAGLIEGKPTSEFSTDLAYLRATDGWREIMDTAAKIQPALRPEG